MKTKTVVMISFSLWIGSGPRAGAAEIPRNAGTKRAKPASDTRLAPYASDRDHPWNRLH